MTIRMAAELLLCLMLLYWLKAHHFTEFEFFGLAPLYEASRLPWILGAFFFGIVLQRQMPVQWKTRVSLLSSLAVGMAAYPTWTPLIFMLTLGPFAIVHRVGSRASTKLLALTAFYGALASAAWQSPQARGLVLIFVSMTFFRTLLYLHQAARQGYAPHPLEDYLAYQLPAASFIIHPYLVVIPPFSPQKQAATTRPLHRSGTMFIWYGLLQLMAAYGLAATLRFIWPEAPEEALSWHLWAITDLLYILLYCAANAAFLIGLMRLQGIDVKPAFNHPWFSTSLFDYWNRFIIHYKDMQVTLFYYPTVLSLRKRRQTIAILAGVAVTFILGNNLVHLFGRYLYTQDLYAVFPHAVLQNLALAIVMGMAFLWEDYKRRRRAIGNPIRIPNNPPSRVIRIYITLAITGWIWHL